MRRWTGWLALGVLGLGLCELAASARARTTAPTEAEYSQLPALLGADFQPGDLVVVSPRWAEPHVRATLGDAYFPLSALARSDSQRFSRAIEISLSGQRSSELAGFRELSLREHGPLAVRVLENPKPEPVSFDFVERLGPAHASAFGTEPAAPCAWSTRSRVASGGLGGHPTYPASRFECPDGFHFNVSATIIADEKFLPRRCIFAHPPFAGERVVRFERVKLAERIVGHAGMYWVIERTRRGAPVDLRITVNGEELGRVTHQDGEGWRRFELPLGGHAFAQDATVEFAVSSGDPANRHFCFQADSR